MGLGPPTQHENRLPCASRGSGNFGLSWYGRVRNESDVGAFGTPHCRVRARRAESCIEGSSSGDRKSTRLNSSHSQISYAVFCLKKKKIPRDGPTRPTAGE